MSKITSTGCSIVATANAGCHLQLENGFKLIQADGDVRHPVSLLAEAYRAEGSAANGINLMQLVNRIVSGSWKAWVRTAPGR